MLGFLQACWVVSSQEQAQRSQNLSQRSCKLAVWSGCVDGLWNGVSWRVWKFLHRLVPIAARRILFPHVADVAASVLFVLQLFLTWLKCTPGSLGTWLVWLCIFFFLLCFVCYSDVNLACSELESWLSSFEWVRGTGQINPVWPPTG